MHYNLDKTAQNVVQLLREKKLTLCTAESCTGGLLSGAVTAIAGSSEVFNLGIVAYANEIKEKMLGVKPETLEIHGAVSAECAAEMAAGARKLAKNSPPWRGGREADGVVGISITGIAGPGGGTPQKPVGTVYFACTCEEKTNILHLQINSDNREYIRLESVRQALILILNTIL
ncbi:MAG: CinA family protein [Oscillospiraceae bacterium]|nr:CinA family protein [Oscillospiraceae bacterium]